MGPMLVAVAAVAAAMVGVVDVVCVLYVESGMYSAKGVRKGETDVYPPNRPDGSRERYTHSLTV